MIYGIDASIKTFGYTKCQEYIQGLYDTSVITERQAVWALDQMSMHHLQERGTLVAFALNLWSDTI